jgi:hypothetical protein
MRPADITPAEIAARLRQLADRVDFLLLRSPSSTGVELRKLADDVEQHTVSAGPWVAIGQALRPHGPPLVE